MHYKEAKGGYRERLPRIDPKVVVRITVDVESYTGWCSCPTSRQMSRNQDQGDCDDRQVGTASSNGF